MLRHCSWFDRYRDGALNPAQKAEFESHIAVCDACRMKERLLNRLVIVLEREEVGRPAAPANLVAARAFEEPPSWDALLVSWLSPAPAWSAVVVLLVLFSFVWMAPTTQQTGSSSEYEVLMSPGDQADSVGSPSGSLTDDELERWLGQRGNTQ
jgi:anti-sigma factor RsiW